MPINRLAGFVLIFVLFCLWEVSARLGWIVSDNWPPVTRILAALVAEFLAGDLPRAIASTLYRMSTGYVIGVSVSVVVGILLTSIPILRRMFEPLLELLRPIPAPAIIPPLILFLGVDDPMKITIVAVTAFFPVAINTMQGVAALEPTYFAVARTFRLGPLRQLVTIVLPGILPYILAGMRISLALALVVAIVGEMIAGSSGLGYYLVLMQYAARAAEMYGAVFVIAIVGYLLNLMFVAAERRLIFWYGATS
jgi:ABC-type nitrate/sulfonate/bicarbonate transport system permease component